MCTQHLWIQLAKLKLMTGILFQDSKTLFSNLNLLYNLHSPMFWMKFRKSSELRNTINIFMMSVIDINNLCFNILSSLITYMIPSREYFAFKVYDPNWRNFPGNDEFYHSKLTICFVFRIQIKILSIQPLSLLTNNSNIRYVWIYYMCCIVSISYVNGIRRSDHTIGVINLWIEKNQAAFQILIY